MRLLVISDTHNRHRELMELPVADVIVHCGDVTENGSEEEAMDFLKWFLDLPYKYKIFIAGNHDFCLHGAEIEGLPENCYHLNYNPVVIEGIKFYGLPYSVSDDKSGNYWIKVDNIPLDTDVLISHNPPYGILDYANGLHYGSLPLLKRVKQINPLYHVFGHIHKSVGLKKINNTMFINAAVIENISKPLPPPYHIIDF